MRKLRTVLREASGKVLLAYSPVGKKSNQRWLWHAIDRNTDEVLAYHFGQRKDKVFKALQKKLSCCDIDFYYTGDWGAYDRNLSAFSKASTWQAPHTSN